MKRTLLVMLAAASAAFVGESQTGDAEQTYESACRAAFSAANLETRLKARLRMAECLELGLGVEPDFDAAVDAYRAVAEDGLGCPQLRGRASEWLWAHGNGRLPGFDMRSAAEYAPDSRPEAAPSPVLSPGPRPLFPADAAAAAVLVAGSDEFSAALTGLGTVLHMDDFVPEDVRWAALWSGPVAVPRRTGRGRAVQWTQPDPVDVVLAVALRRPPRPPSESDGVCRPFQEHRLIGWDVQSLGVTFLDEVVVPYLRLEPCLTFAPGGVVLLASSREALRRAVRMYRAGEGGSLAFDDLTDGWRSRAALRVPAAGTFLRGIFDDGQLDELGSACVADGASALGGFRRLDVCAYPAKGGGLRLEARAEAGTPRDATRLRVPLAAAVRVLGGRAKSFDGRLPSAGRDILSNLRAKGVASEIVLESFLRGFAFRPDASSPQ